MPLPMFLAELKETATAEELIAKNLVCQKYGMIFKVEEFRALPLIRQCYYCQGFGHSAQNCRKQHVCLICREGHCHKECTKAQPKCGNRKGPQVASYEGCPHYQSQAFRQHVVSSQKSYASILKSSPPQNAPSMSFSAEKLIDLVTTTVVKVAQPQLCYSNLAKEPQKRSQMCVKKYQKWHKKSQESSSKVKHYLRPSPQ